ncbi:MAG: hypothetical protein U0361_20260 [Nitrospiraceae bacterium]
MSLFEGTIEENIVLGRNYVPYSDVRWALRFTELEEEIDALPQGLKTHVRAQEGLRPDPYSTHPGRPGVILARPQLLIFDGILHSMQPALGRRFFGGSAARMSPGP